MDQRHPTATNGTTPPVPDPGPTGEACVSARGEQAVAGMAELDRAGTFTHVDPHVCALTGYTDAALRARRVEDITHPDDLPVWRARFADAVVHGTPFMQDQRWLRHLGAAVWVRTSVAVIRDHDGQPARMVVVVMDMTARKQVEAQVRERHTRRAFVIDAAKIGEWTLDLATGQAQHTFLHDQCFGATAPLPDWSYDIFLGYVHPDDRVAVERAFGAAMQGHTPWHFQCRVVWPDTSVHWIEAHGYFYGDDQGPATSLVGIVTNITDRKHAEAAARVATERFAVVAQATNDAIWDWDLRTQQVWWNDGVGTLFGYASDQVDPHSAWWYAHIHPDDRARVVSSIHQVIDAGEHTWASEYRFRRVDGTVAEVSDRGFVLHDDCGTPVRMVGGMTDITARNRAEHAVRESEARFRLMVDAVPQSIWITDAAGRVEYLNQHWLDYSGTADQPPTAAEIAARFIHPEDQPGLLAAFTTALETGTPFEIEQRNRAASGAYRWFLNRATPYRDPHTGTITKWFGVGIDIHDRKQAEAERAEALAAAEAALHTRDQFLSIAAHELRTPLTSLLGYASMLPRVAARGAWQVEKMTERIVRQAERLNGLINQLLDVSRLQRGQFVVTRRPLDVTALVRQVVDDTRAAVPANSPHTVALTAPSDSVVVDGDAERLEQVLHNLLSNAIKYSPLGGTVQVEVTRTATEAVVAVTDHGIGIPADAQARLFEPFYRAPNVGTQASGFGVGLHIVREIVARHGGRVEVESTDGVGSTFRVVLPVPETAA